eukprot:s217_g19.t1
MEGGCRELENGVTYFLTTSNPGVLYDMMDNPLPILDTNQSGSWRFYVNENVTRAPEVLRVNYDFNITETAIDVHGYIYFTQRVFRNGSFPGTTKSFSEIEIRDCGVIFDCSTFQVLEPEIYVEPWGSGQLSLEPGLVSFRFEAPRSAQLFQVRVESRSFMGSLAGPLEAYTFPLETGPDPRLPPDRPFVLPGGVTPLGQKVPAETNVTLLFNEEVLPGSGNISFCTQLTQDNGSCGP